MSRQVEGLPPVALGLASTVLGSIGLVLCLLPILGITIATWGLLVGVAGLLPGLSAGKSDLRWAFIGSLLCADVRDHRPDDRLYANYPFAHDRNRAGHLDSRRSGVHSSAGPARRVTPAVPTAANRRSLSKERVLARRRFRSGSSFCYPNRTDRPVNARRAEIASRAGPVAARFQRYRAIVQNCRPRRRYRPKLSDSLRSAAFELTRRIRVPPCARIKSSASYKSTCRDSALGNQRRLRPSAT